ncbi:MAG: fatty acid desaturase family protein [Acidimicrobiales bacterium]|jgi:fatty acid desaturase
MTDRGSAARSERYKLGRMVASADALPYNLPTERLQVTGMAVREIRAELRHIPNWRSAIAVVRVLAEPFFIAWVAVQLSHPLVWMLAFLLMGPTYARFASLGHEAVHRTLFSNRAANDFVGRWLMSYPTFVPFDLYRRSHINHHRDEMGPKEPDIPLYSGYPITRKSLGRKLFRDARGQTGWKLFRGLLRGLRSPKAKTHARRIVGAQLVLLSIATAFGRPELYLFLWFLPYLTVWRVINRLRAIAEHGGMERSADRRRTTHHVHQGPASGFVMVPFKIGYHLAHHVDMGVPCWNLPKLQRELDASGWVTDEYGHKSYCSLWKALSSA